MEAMSQGFRKEPWNMSIKLFRLPYENLPLEFQVALGVHF